jgi:hypothetical protein
MNPRIISPIAVLTLLLFSSFTGKNDHVYEYLNIVDLTLKPVIEVALNGKKAYFLIDTGSDITILNTRDAKKYGFGVIKRAFENHSLVGMGGSVASIYSTYDVELKVGSSRVMNRYLAHDLSRVVKMLEQKISIQISGIIGSDLMKRYGFVIDYANKQVGILTVKPKNEPVDEEEIIATTTQMK